MHDRPDPDRLVDLREVLESFGYELKGDLEEVPPAAFQKLLAAIEGKPEERLLHDLLLRAQRKAVYSEECRGHYALAAPYYCHFTSPIRRYPDLIVHRQLSRLLADGRPVAARDFETVQQGMREIATVSSERERRAEQAERESLLWKKIVFMRDKVDREFDAYVTGVASFGVFVTLKDYFVEGLVPISALGNDFFVYEEKQHRLRGRSSGQTLPAGRFAARPAGRDRRGPPAARLPARGSGVRGAHGSETHPPGGSGRCGGDASARSGLWTDGPAPSAEEVPMRRAGLLSLAAVLVAVSGCRQPGRPEPRHPHGRLARPRRGRAGVVADPAGGGRAAREALREARAESVPTRLEVPPEVAQAWSGIRLGWKDKQSGKEGTVDVPLGRGVAPAGPVARRAGRRLSPGVHDGRRSDHLPGRRAAEPGGPDHGVREGQGDLRRLDLHAVPGRAPLHASAVPAPAGGRRSQGPEVTRAPDEARPSAW